MSASSEREAVSICSRICEEVSLLMTVPSDRLINAAHSPDRATQAEVPCKETSRTISVAADC